MKNNKLIAEFMGLENQILSTDNIHSWSDAPFFYITKDSKEKVMKGIAKYSKYHTSWDWLMPVVSKCRCNSDSEDSHWEEIYYTLEECNLNTTYKAVVEFINEYNQNK